GDDEEIRTDELSMLLQKLWKVCGTDFFFALDQELDVERERALRLDQGLQRLKVHKHLPLVVACAPSPNVSITDGRLKGRRRPQVDRINRLDVVVTVNQRCGPTGLIDALGVYDRMKVRR